MALFIVLLPSGFRSGFNPIAYSCRVVPLHSLNYGRTYIASECYQGSKNPHLIGLAQCDPLPLQLLYYIQRK